MGCVRDSPEMEKKKKKKSQHGMCKRNSPDKIEANTGCVRETSHIKIRSQRDV